MNSKIHIYIERGVFLAIYMAPRPYKDMSTPCPYIPMQWKDWVRHLRPPPPWLSMQLYALPIHAKIRTGPGSHLYEIQRSTLKFDHLNGHEVTGPLPLGSCRHSVHKLDVDVQIAWVRHHFMDGTLCYVAGVGDHLLSVQGAEKNCAQISGFRNLTFNMENCDFRPARNLEPIQRIR